MWPFRRKSTAEDVIKITPDVIKFSSEKWIIFCDQLPFKENVALEDKVIAFLIPLTEGLKNNFTALKSAPDHVFLFFAAMGIVASGTHSREEIEKALDCSLPDLNV